MLVPALLAVGLLVTAVSGCGSDTSGPTTPYTVVAVDPKDVGYRPEAAFPDQYPVNGLLGVEDLVSVDERSVSARLLHGACETGLLGHVWEASDLVVVGGTASGGSDGPCPSIGLLTPTTVFLAAPLGDRPVVDVQTGRLLVVGAP